MMSRYSIFALATALTLASCGCDKNKPADPTDDEVVLGNPEKVAFVEDFYEKYFDALGDRESLSNFMTDLVSEHGVEVIKNMAGEGQDAFVNVFKPVAIDTIADRSKIAVDVSQIDNNDDLLYRVVITDESGQPHTIDLAVEGDKGSFKIDSIFNSDYKQAE